MSEETESVASETPATPEAAPVALVTPATIEKTPKQKAAEAIKNLKTVRAAQWANPAADAIRMGTETDDYLPLFGINPVMTLTPPGSAPTVVQFQGIKKYTLPSRKYLKTTDYILTGTHKGKGLVTATCEQPGTLTMTAVYGATHRAALDAAVGINGSAISVTVNDGSTYVGVGVLTEVGEGQQGENNTLESTIVVDFNGGWVFTAGGSGPSDA